jgi:uncharacterized protein (TIGR03435 family)
MKERHTVTHLTEFRQCSRRRLLLIGLAAAGLALAPSHAQQPTDAPKPPQAAAAAPMFEYDVVSVKEYKFEGGSFYSDMRWDPNGLTAMNISLYSLIRMAYGLDRFHVSGGSDWAQSALFQVQARMDDATVEALRKLPSEEAIATRRRMLQAVLADRFKLTVRRETRLFPAYALVVAKGRPKLQESPPADAHTETAATPTAPVGHDNIELGNEDGGYVITGNFISLDSLAVHLS